MRAAFALLMNWDLFENQKFYLLRQTAAAVLTGVGGTLLVTIFLAILLPLFKAVHFIPWLIGFNTAMTGYSLVEKTRTSLRYRHIAAIGAGISNVLITAGILIGLSVYTIGSSLFSPSDLMVFLLIGAVCSEFGAWLAVKYHTLNKKSN